MLARISRLLFPPKTPELTLSAALLHIYTLSGMAHYTPSHMMLHIIILQLLHELLELLHRLHASLNLLHIDCCMNCCIDYCMDYCMNCCMDCCMNRQIIKIKFKISLKPRVELNAASTIKYHNFDTNYAP